MNYEIIVILLIKIQVSMCSNSNITTVENSEKENGSSRTTLSDAKLQIGEKNEIAKSCNDEKLATNDLDSISQSSDSDYYSESESFYSELGRDKFDFSESPIIHYSYICDDKCLLFKRQASSLLSVNNKNCPLAEEEDFDYELSSPIYSEGNSKVSEFPEKNLKTK